MFALKLYFNCLNQAYAANKLICLEITYISMCVFMCMSVQNSIHMYGEAIKRKSHSTLATHCSVVAIANMGVY